MVEIGAHISFLWLVEKYSSYLKTQNVAISNAFQALFTVYKQPNAQTFKDNKPLGNPLEITGPTLNWRMQLNIL